MSTAADLLRPDLRDDPYPLYAELLESNGGVHHAAEAGCWFVLRYDDVQRLARDRAHWSSDIFGTGTGFGAHDPTDPVHRRYAQVEARNLLTLDDPDHKRLRSLVSHAFTGRAAKAWKPAIEIAADQVLDPIVEGAPVDVVEEVAAVVPVSVVSQLLGVPIADRDHFKKLSNSLTETFDPVVVGDRRDGAIRDSVELFDYIRDLARDRARVPGDDLLTTLLDAEADGTRLTEDEVIATVAILLVAGNETTANLIASGLALLTRHPDQWRSLQADPALVDTMLLEVLRYESPLQFNLRIATHDVEIGEQTIPGGAHVFFGLGAANRDPRAFPQPDEFDIRRGDRRHLAFGAGAHFCIGNTLALTEGAVFYRRLLDRFTDVEQAGDAVMITDRLFQRGYGHVPVRFSKGRDNARSA